MAVAPMMPVKVRVPVDLDIHFPMYTRTRVDMNINVPVDVNVPMDVGRRAGIHLDLPVYMHDPAAASRQAQGDHGNEHHASGVTESIPHGVLSTLAELRSADSAPTIRTSAPGIPYAGLKKKRPAKSRRPLS